MLKFLCAAALLAAVTAADPTTVYPDRHWNDTDGNRIEAHAAGMLQSPIDNRWYWYGESKKTSGLGDHGVNCYSAATIAGPWKNEGQVSTKARFVASVRAHSWLDPPGIPSDGHQDGWAERPLHCRAP